MRSETEFVWLDLKPQQNFKDDEENRILKLVQSATEFAFLYSEKMAR